MYFTESDMKIYCNVRLVIYYLAVKECKIYFKMIQKELIDKRHEMLHTIFISTTTYFIYFEVQNSNKLFILWANVLVSIFEKKKFTLRCKKIWRNFQCVMVPWRRTRMFANQDSSFVFNTGARQCDFFSCLDFPLFVYEFVVNL